MVATLPSPNNFLACREARQVAKIRLIQHEDFLLKLFGVNNIVALEEQMLKTCDHPDEVKKYQQLHEAFEAADSLFDAACSIQRSRIAEDQ